MPFTLTREDAASIFLPRKTGNTGPLFGRCTPSTRFSIGASLAAGEGLSGVYTLEQFKDKFVRGLFALFDVAGSAEQEFTFMEVVGNTYVEESIVTARTKTGEDYYNK